ncbi:Crp/Fnr family transcriptional regulator [Emticicia sp. 17c]|uniref:Crp/Fnr family transcriptional regulator n=1 Tax=Emticicia sp. 17c TaxID=3127704 RepID=UPI00301BFF3E
MTDALLQLRQLVTAIAPFSENDWENFAGIWKIFSAKRKEIITTIDDTERYLYFVAEGVQRVYYFDEQGREATLVFTYNPSFGGVIDSFILQQPSKYFYETLTPSVFLRASYYDFQKQMAHNTGIELLLRQGIAQVLSGVLTRLVELQCYSSEERFLQLLKRSPHILQLVPHKYLANYLGIDATNFSKLINKLKI